MYAIIPQDIPRERRAELNARVLQGIGARNPRLTGDMVYNIYSGVGGLHGLRREDFDSYHHYAQAKREFEMGQFFTPHSVCRQMVAMADPKPEEKVADLCCGMGKGTVRVQGSKVSLRTQKPFVL